MKKSLIALAALAATASFAQSSVTLYGVLDVAYGAKQIEAATGALAAKQGGIMDGGFAGNRIGFKGVEDLGAGKSLSFVTEQGISPTNGALFGVRTATAGMQLDGYAASTGKFDQGTAGAYSQSTNRQTYVGLSDKDLGEIRAGYQYTSLYEISTLMGFTTMSEGVYGGSISHLFGNGAAGGTRANGLNYISPRFNGFGASVQMGSGAGRETTEFSSGASNTAAGWNVQKNKRSSLKLDYANGPWTAAYGLTKFAFQQGATASNCFAPSANAGTDFTGTKTDLCSFNVYGALTSVGQSALTTANAYNTTLNQLAGAYTASNWKVGAQMIRGTYSVTDAAFATGVGTTGTAPSAGTQSAVGDYKIKSQRLSGQYTVGAVDLIAGAGTSALDASTGRVVDIKESQIGAMYNLSKTAKLYVYNGSWTNNSSTTATKGKATVVGLYKAF